MIIEDDYAGAMRVPCDIFLMISHKIAEIEEGKKVRTFMVIDNLALVLFP